MIGVAMSCNNLSAVIAGNKLVIESLEGRAPHLTEGWREASLNWPNEACRMSLIAYRHDDLEVVRAVQKIVSVLVKLELPPMMDMDYLYIPRL